MRVCSAEVQNLEMWEEVQFRVEQSTGCDWICAVGEKYECVCVIAQDARIAGRSEGRE